MSPRGFCCALGVAALAALAHSQALVVKPGLFSYKGPAGFARDDSRVAAGHFGLFAPPVHDYSPNIAIGVAKTQFPTAEALGKSETPNIKRNPEVKGVHTTTVAMGGSKAFVIDSTRTLGTGLVVSQCQVVAVRKGSVVILTLSTLKARAAKDSAALLASLRSFKWRN